MVDKVTLSNISTFTNDSTATTTYNANNVAITAAMDNTLSRDGTTPNTMNSFLDMNNNSVINLPPPSSLSSPLRLQDVNTNVLTNTALQNIASLTLPDQTLSGGANVTSKSLTAGSQTIDCGLCPLQFITNSAGFTLTAPTHDGTCMILVTNAAGAGTITFSGFTVGASTGDPLTIVNGNKFTISIWRINGISAYRVIAHQ